MRRRYQAQVDLDNYRCGLVCATLANLHRDPKKRKKPFEPSDFFPFERQDKPKRMTDAGMFAHMMSVHQRLKNK